MKLNIIAAIMALAAYTVAAPVPVPAGLSKWPKGDPGCDNLPPVHGEGRRPSDEEVREYYHDRYGLWCNINHDY